MLPRQSDATVTVVDVDDLLDRCLGNIEFAEHILNVFQNRCAEDLTELERVIDEQNMEAAARIAHRLQGACANAAACGMRSRAAMLRGAAVEQSREEVAARFGELRQEWTQFLAAAPHLVAVTDELTSS